MSHLTSCLQANSAHSKAKDRCYTPAPCQKRQPTAPGKGSAIYNTKKQGSKKRERGGLAPLMRIAPGLAQLFRAGPVLILKPPALQCWLSNSHFSFLSFPLPVFEKFMHDIFTLPNWLQVLHTSLGTSQFPAFLPVTSLVEAAQPDAKK